MSSGAQHPMGDADVARGLGHTVELRARVVLDDDEATGVVDGANPARAVAAAAGEDDGDGAGPAVLRQRPEEDIDRERELLLPIALAEEQAAARDDHLLARRDQVNVVRLDLHPVLDEGHRQLRTSRQELVHQTLEVRRQVLHDHEGHARVRGQVVEEGFERFEAPRRGADADHVPRGGGSDGFLVHGLPRLALSPSPERACWASLDGERRAVPLWRVA